MTIRKTNGDITMLMSGDWSNAFRKLQEHSEQDIKELRGKHKILQFFLPKAWVRSLLFK